MRHRQWSERLSEYIDRSLDATEQEGMELHLAECAECRSILEQLGAVVSGARDLGGLEPPRELWPGIAAAIGRPDSAGGRAQEGKVIALPTAAPKRAPIQRGAPIALSRMQLAAASIALITVSAAVTLWFGSDRSVAAGPSPAPQGPAVMAASVPAPPEGMAAELAALEGALDAALDALDPTTVRVLERNLAIIEGAIEDSHRALAQDPESEFLARHLERVYRRKLTYLRDTRQLADWAS